MTPAVSVVIPIYQVEPYLRQCLDSVLGQTLHDIEIIAVDDGSPDGCPAICDDYAKKDSRVRVIHKPNGGLVSAWKAGVRAASGEYIGFVDGDDWVDPGYYEDLYRAITEAGADVVVGERSEDQEGRPSIVSRRERTVEYAGPEDIRRLMALFFTNFLHDEDRAALPITYSRCDKLYRRALFAPNMDLFNEHIALDEDRIANGALLADCRKVLVLSGTAKYHYRVSEGTMSSGYDERQINTLGELHASLMAVARAKGLDEGPILVYVGRAAYRRVFRTAEQRDLPFAEKCGRVKTLLRQTPPGALSRYAAARGGLFAALFCAMLERGWAAPCVGLVMLHRAVQG